MATGIHTSCTVRPCSSSCHNSCHPLRRRQLIFAFLSPSNNDAIDSPFPLFVACHCCLILLLVVMPCRWSMQDIDSCACLTLLTTTHCCLKDLRSLGNVDMGRRRHQRPVPPGPNPPRPCPHVGVIIINDNGQQRQGFQFEGQPLPLLLSLF